MMTSMFVPGSVSSAQPLVLLHGSGGDENELLALTAEVAPGAPALGLRGTVEIDGGFAFFHRRPDRTIDEDDVHARILPVAEFIAVSASRRGFAKPPLAVGFSNGAIMAAALLLTGPAHLTGAILFRPLSPFTEDPPANLQGKSVLIIDGEKDSRRNPGDGARLAERLRKAGATVTHHVLPVGHSITEMDRQIARGWIAALG